MAYNPVPSAANGHVFTGTYINRYIRDNFAACVPDIFTAKGDLAVASGADAASPLAVGADGQLLVASSAATLGIAWGGPGRVRAAGGTQTIKVNGANDVAGWLKLTLYDTETFDVYGAWADDRFTALIPGYYFVGLTSYIDVDTSYFYALSNCAQLGIYKNGTLFTKLGYNHVRNDDTLQTKLNIPGSADVLYLAAGDYLEFYLYHDFTTAITNMAIRWQVTDRPLAIALI